MILCILFRCESEESLQLAAKCRWKLKDKEIAPIDNKKLSKIYDDFVPQKQKTEEELYFLSPLKTEVSPLLQKHKEVIPFEIQMSNLEKHLEKPQPNTPISRGMTTFKKLEEMVIFIEKAINAKIKYEIPSWDN